MAFAFKMILRLMALALLFQSLAVAWIVRDVEGNLRNDVAASAARAAVVIQDRTRFGTGAQKADLLMSVIKVMGPGICVDLAGSLFEANHVCSGWGDIGAAPPSWFRTFVPAIPQSESNASRAIMINGQEVEVLVASADQEVMIRKAWAQVRTVAMATIMTTSATALLALLVVGHALLPARTLIMALRRLEKADYATRLPRFDQVEFRRISHAFNDLADRLETTSAERSALTRRLFLVQEEERQVLARELHDEFGQCLTSTAALAASIDGGATLDRPDLAEDARVIGEIVARMTITLRSALERLRPPELEDLGLEGSLRHLVNVWNRRRGPGVRFAAEILTGPPPLPRQVELAVYRIAQECMTNAVRHGDPSEVTMTLICHSGKRDAVRLVVEDNGRRGDQSKDKPLGHGILGMRERVAALGGCFSAGPNGDGFRVEALIPCRIEETHG
jgi:two-component system sensor histidine kinase UhpB